MAVAEWLVLPNLWLLAKSLLIGFIPLVKLSSETYISTLLLILDCSTLSRSYSMRCIMCFCILLENIPVLSCSSYRTPQLHYSNIQHQGPVLRAAFQLPDLVSLLRGTAYKDTKALHDRYGSVVRLAPNTLSYNSSQAWKGLHSTLIMFSLYQDWFVSIANQ
jgi:hypothetical protein